MAVLQAAQSAAIRLIGQRPQSIFSLSDTFSLEMQDLLNEAGRVICDHQAWRAQTLLTTINGDGVTTTFPFPVNFDRMLNTGEMHPSQWPTWRHQQILDLDRWTDIQRIGITVSPGYWTIIGNSLVFDPPIPAGETCSYWYVSKYYAQEPNGVPKAAFTLDTDEFVLPNADHLLTLYLIWAWREQKGLSYSESFAKYEVALADYAGKDGGPKVFSVGRPNWVNNSGWPVNDWI